MAVDRHTLGTPLEEQVHHVLDVLEVDQVVGGAGPGTTVAEVDHHPRPAQLGDTGVRAQSRHLVAQPLGRVGALGGLGLEGVDLPAHVLVPTLGSVTALSELDGHQLWINTDNGASNGSPAFTGDGVYVG